MREIALKLVPNFDVFVQGARKLIRELIKLIDFCFNGVNKNFIEINNLGKASWGKKTKDSISFTKIFLKVAVKHLIENCFFTVGNTTMRQAI